MDVWKEIYYWRKLATKHRWGLILPFLLGVAHALAVFLIFYFTFSSNRDHYGLTGALLSLYFGIYFAPQFWLSLHLFCIGIFSRKVRIRYKNVYQILMSANLINFRTPIASSIFPPVLNSAWFRYSYFASFKSINQISEILHKNINILENTPNVKNDPLEIPSLNNIQFVEVLQKHRKTAKKIEHPLVTALCFVLPLLTLMLSSIAFSNDIGIGEAAAYLLSMPLAVMFLFHFLKLIAHLVVDAKTYRYFKYLRREINFILRLSNVGYHRAISLSRTPTFWKIPVPKVILCIFFILFPLYICFIREYLNTWQYDELIHYFKYFDVQWVTNAINDQYGPIHSKDYY